MLGLGVVEDGQHCVARGQHGQFGQHGVSWTDAGAGEQCAEAEAEAEAGEQARHRAPHLRSTLYALRSTLYALEAVDRWNCSLSLLFQENDGPGVLLISALLPLPQIDSLWLFMKLYQ
jgi:hypothetical protein